MNYFFADFYSSFSMCSHPGTHSFYMLDFLTDLMMFKNHLFPIFHLSFYSTFWEISSAFASNPPVEFFISAILVLISKGSFLFSECFLFIWSHYLLWWLSGKESATQCKRSGFDPWVRKIPWRRKWQSTPVFLPGESRGQRSLAGYTIHGVTKELDQVSD